METETISDATVIESNPLPNLDMGDALMMAGSFFAGYFLGKRKKAVKKKPTRKSTKK